MSVPMGRIAFAVAGAALSIVAFSHDATVSAQTTLHCWTAVGSDGTVDEADLSKVALGANTAGVLNAVANATVDIRYNVVAVDDVFGGDATTKNLRARFADNGAQSQVIVRLSRLNIFNGVISVLAEIDSNDYAPSKFAQTQTVGFNCQQAEFDFLNNIYYVEVELRKTGAVGNPLVRAITLCGDGIC